MQEDKKHTSSEIIIFVTKHILLPQALNYLETEIKENCIVQWIFFTIYDDKNIASIVSVYIFVTWFKRPLEITVLRRYT